MIKAKYGNIWEEIVPENTSDLYNDSGFITEDKSAHQITLNLNSENQELSAILSNKKGKVISQSNGIHIPKGEFTFTPHISGNSYISTDKKIPIEDADEDLYATCISKIDNDIYLLARVYGLNYYILFKYNENSDEFEYYKDVDLNPNNSTIYRMFKIGDDVFFIDLFEDCRLLLTQEYSDYISVSPCPFNVVIISDPNKIKNTVYAIDLDTYQIVRFNPQTYNFDMVSNLHINSITYCNNIYYALGVEETEDAQLLHLYASEDGYNFNDIGITNIKTWDYVHDIEGHSPYDIFYSNGTYIMLMNSYDASIDEYVDSYASSIDLLNWDITLLPYNCDELSESIMKALDNYVVILDDNLFWGFGSNYYDDDYESYSSALITIKIPFLNSKNYELLINKDITAYTGSQCYIDNDKIFIENYNVTTYLPYITQQQVINVPDENSKLLFDGNEVNEVFKNGLEDTVVLNPEEKEDKDILKYDSKSNQWIATKSPQFELGTITETIGDDVTPKRFFSIDQFINKNNESNGQFTSNTKLFRVNNKNILCVGISSTPMNQLLVRFYEITDDMTNMQELGSYNFDIDYIQNIVYGSFNGSNETYFLWYENVIFSLEDSDDWDSWDVCFSEGEVQDLRDVGDKIYVTIKPHSPYNSDYISILCIDKTDGTFQTVSYSEFDGMDEWAGIYAFTKVGDKYIASASYNRETSNNEKDNSKLKISENGGDRLYISDDGINFGLPISSINYGELNSGYWNYNSIVRNNKISLSPLKSGGYVYILRSPYIISPPGPMPTTNSQSNDSTTTYNFQVIIFDKDLQPYAYMEYSVELQNSNNYTLISNPFIVGNNICAIFEKTMYANDEQHDDYLLFKFNADFDYTKYTSNIDNEFNISDPALLDDSICSVSPFTGTSYPVLFSDNDPIFYNDAMIIESKIRNNDEEDMQSNGYTDGYTLFDISYQSKEVTELGSLYFDGNKVNDIFKDGLCNTFINNPKDKEDKDIISYNQEKNTWEAKKLKFECKEKNNKALTKFEFTEDNYFNSICVNSQWSTDDTLYIYNMNVCNDELFATSYTNYYVNIYKFDKYSKKFMRFGEIEQDHSDYVPSSIQYFNGQYFTLIQNYKQNFPQYISGISREDYLGELFIQKDGEEEWISPDDEYNYLNIHAIDDKLFYTKIDEDFNIRSYVLDKYNKETELPQFNNLSSPICITKVNDKYVGLAVNLQYDDYPFYLSGQPGHSTVYRRHDYGNIYVSPGSQFVISNDGINWELVGNMSSHDEYNDYNAFSIDLDRNLVLNYLEDIGYVSVVQTQGISYSTNEIHNEQNYAYLETVKIKISDNLSSNWNIIDINNELISVDWLFVNATQIGDTIIVYGDCESEYYDIYGYPCVIALNKTNIFDGGEILSDPHNDWHTYYDNVMNPCILDNKYYLYDSEYKQVFYYDILTEKKKYIDNIHFESIEPGPNWVFTVNNKLLGIYEDTEENKYYLIENINGVWSEEFLYEFEAPITDIIYSNEFGCYYAFTNFYSDKCIYCSPNLTSWEFVSDYETPYVDPESGNEYPITDSAIQPLEGIIMRLGYVGELDRLIVSYLIYDEWQSYYEVDLPLNQTEKQKVANAYVSDLKLYNFKDNNLYAAVRYSGDSYSQSIIGIIHAGNEPEFFEVNSDVFFSIETGTYFRDKYYFSSYIDRQELYSANTFDDLINGNYELVTKLNQSIYYVTDIKVFNNVLYVYGAYWDDMQTKASNNTEGDVEESSILYSTDGVTFNPVKGTVYANYQSLTSYNNRLYACHFAHIIDDDYWCQAVDTINIDYKYENSKSLLLNGTDVTDDIKEGLSEVFVTNPDGVKNNDILIYNQAQDKWLATDGYSKFGKIKDIKINGNSIVQDDDIARFNIPTIHFDEDNHAIVFNIPLQYPYAMTSDEAKDYGYQFDTYEV